MIESLAFQLIVCILLFAFCSYACIFANPETSSLGKFCTVTLLSKLVGPKKLSRLTKLSDHAFQFVYLIVVLGSWSIVFAYGYPQIQASKFISSYHQYTGYLVFLACMSSWHYACQKRPGSVTSQTMPLFDHYAYDDVLYTNKVCPTLKIRKIARSKYDRFSKAHIPRFDHFCGWLNMAVGERNYKWFLVFLGVHVGMCIYGTWAMGCVLVGEVLEKDLLNATFFNAVTGAEVQADYIIVFHYLFARHFQICGVLILMSVMSVVLGIFLGFHLYITSQNMTTNEFFKWRAVKRWHKREKAKYERALKDGKIGRTKNSECGAVEGGQTTKHVPDGDVGCTGPIKEVEQSSEHSGVISDDEIVDPGPMPKNIYNKGMISNFSEVFFPLSFCEDAIRRYRAALIREDSIDVANRSTNNQKSLDESMLKTKAM